MITVEFFPCNASYKTPVGGVKTNNDFTLNILSNADRAELILTKQGETSVRYPMTKTDGGFTLTMAVTTRGLYYYYFDVFRGDEHASFFADKNLRATAQATCEWQLTAYDETYAKPTTFDGGIIYQIMVDRFCRGDERFTTKTGVIYRDDWEGTPYHKPDEQGIVRNNDMFGGNLYGVIAKLDYLKSLNVKCIYLNPIFEAASNHKYDTGSYNRVDGDFGGDEALIKLIAAAKKKGISIMLDGVFSHTGDDSLYFNKYANYDSVGAYQREDSPYYEWYDFTDYPDKYGCWWGINTLPQVNETNPSYTEFITGEDGIIRKYIRMGVAGWRLDVADELPDEFLTKITAAAKKAHPNAMVLGEVWEDASNKVSYSVQRTYLLGSQLDSVTNYPLKNAIIDYVLSRNASGLAQTLNTILNNYPKRTVDNLMNLLSTHDTRRIITALSYAPEPPTKDERANAVIDDYDQAVERLKIAATLQYTLPGTPCVYYGDEAGMQGYEDPFNRRCYPWGSENTRLIDFYRVLGTLRKLSAFNGGDFAIVKAEGGIFIFTRGNATVYANVSEDDYPLDKPVFDLLSGQTCIILPSCGAIVSTD